MLALISCVSAAATPETFDYIVVGAGAGGCPVAAKLALAGHSVLLLESGPDDDWTGVAPDPFNDYVPRQVDPMVLSDVATLTYAEEIDDAVMSEHVWATDRLRPPLSMFEGKSPRAEYMPRAKVAGGCTMHNYVIFLRGSPEVYDAWGEGWRWSDLLPTFKAIERDVRRVA